MATVGGGCGGPPRTGPIVAAGPVLPPPPGPTSLDSVFVLESNGAAPEDTVVVVPAGRARVIVLRRGAPDNSLFARLRVTAAGTGDSARVAIRPRPGTYGIDLEIQGRVAGGTTLLLSYAVHFVAPAGARARYGTDLGFEKALFVAQVLPGGRVVFLPTTRPGSDLVEAELPGPGRYLVAAPRS